MKYTQAYSKCSYRHQSALSMNKQDFFQLILSRKEPLKLMALQFTNDENDADELVEGTMLKAIANLRSYRLCNNINGWLYSIMKNRFIQKFKRLVKNSSGIKLDEIVFNDLPYSCVLNKYKFRTSDITNLLLNYKINGQAPFSQYLNPVKFDENAD
ncbi:MAG: polymerase, sigma-24 subunit, subfamily [Daejeonella sp.]|nr:polymerase, sigma-24 subunit, subfamily [Daejeonella sp.]